MFKILKSRNKRTPTFISQQINQFDNDFCEMLFASNLLEEGVYGLESIKNSESTEHYLNTPSFFREMIGEEVYTNLNYLKNSVNDLNCYSIVTEKPSFLPIYTENNQSILQDILLLQKNNDEIFIQLLFRKLNNQWKHSMIDQYEEYLNGNDYPSNSRAGRSIQRSFLKLLNKAANFNSKRNEIKEISEKILDDGYRFELRLATFAKDSEVLETELNEILKEYNFFNELSYVKVKNKKQFIENYLSRSFSDISNHQILSERELISLISEEKIEIVSKKHNSIIKMQEEIKNKTISNVSHNHLFEILPREPKKERKIDNSIGNKLENAFQRVGIKNGDKFSVSNIQLGSTLQKIDVKIPNGANYTDIKKNLENLQLALGIQSISIEISDQPDTVTFLLPCDEREIVYLRNVLENKLFLQYAEDAELPFIVGLDVLNNPIYADLTKIVHLLIAGQTGGGKSQFMNQIIMTLMLMKRSSELMLYLLDPKKVEFPQFEGFPHVKKVITDMSKAEGLFITLLEEMQNRYDFLASKGYKKIGNYNKSNPNNKIPYIIVIIDELASLKEGFPEVESYIQQMGALTRAAGIHLIIATQYPLADVISSTIKENLPSQISFRLKSNISYKTVFGTGIPYRNLLGKGDGVARLEGFSKEFIRFQAPTITIDDEEEKNVCEKLKKMIHGENIRGLEIAEIETESDLDKLKRIIANSGEVRFSKLREQLGKGSGTVKELRDQLVSEGWLEESESKAQGYKLIANEDELNKWREH